MIAAIGVLVVAAVILVLGGLFMAHGSRKTMYVLVYMRRQPRWVGCCELREKFGPGIHAMLSELADAELLELRDQPLDGPMRGAHRHVEYRWKEGR